MTKYFTHKLTTLPLPQQSLWPELKPSIDLGMVLYGGTAVALRIGHRESVDFDFFSNEEINLAMLQEHFSFIDRATILQDQPNTLTMIVPIGEDEASKVKVSFFGGIDIGRVGEPEVTMDGILRVASLDDLMATKVKVLLQRVEAKDYRDIAAMINAGADLSKALASAKAMYGSFQPSECLKAMIYFEGGDLDTLQKSEKLTLTSAVRSVGELTPSRIISKQLANHNNEGVQAEPGRPSGHPRL